MTVFDFSADNDHQPDSNGEFTVATLNAGFLLPESFTICSAIMVEAAYNYNYKVDMFVIHDDDGLEEWATINVISAPTYTVYEARIAKEKFVISTTIPVVFFPLQWTRACLSLDSNASKMRLVVDGQLLGEEEYRREEDRYRPANLSLVLGGDPHYEFEKPIKLADLNVFKSSLSVERMVGLTRAGEEECGEEQRRRAAGDFVSWEEAEWTLHSQAKVIEVDRKWEGPCRRESQVQIFMADFKSHQDCMQHCEKIANGRSPPVTTEEEWESLKTGIYLVNPEIQMYVTDLWLSATEGDKNSELERLDHWPETELVENQTMKLEAVETIWRDFYTGQRLNNWSLPYYEEDTKYNDTSNCMASWLMDIDESWTEWHCYTFDMGCPCSYPAQPLLRLRGLCSPLTDDLFTPKQLPDNPRNMILLGQVSTRIEYNDTSSQWVLTNARSDVTAVSPATELSYLLGKHELIQMKANKLRELCFSSGFLHSELDQCYLVASPSPSFTVIITFNHALCHYHQLHLHHQCHHHHQFPHPPHWAAIC